MKTKRTKLKKVLIANRGEIAVRIIRACREMGIKAVAVYSTADKDSFHTKIADEKICIGPPPAIKSYLSIKNILSAALVANCDAIHPGYGFLAESPEFVSECEENDLVFIGPPKKSIELAGNKARAIEIMKTNKIPVVPGSEGSLKDTRDAVRFAKKVGFPVIIKASFGGGGKGMRICKDKKDVEEFFPLAKTEAGSSFGTDDVYMEKYITRPRHIEFQIIADDYNKYYCLGERECSIQRRHQKLIEESPANKIPPKIKKQMTGFALKAAESIGYKNAGTIEFLVDENMNFYFIEINTRIQVEHPVTEMVTGIDLVKEQLRIASGEKARDYSIDHSPRGHAIEFRINAEDPENDFAPSPGRITDYFLPGGPGIRVDTFIHANYSIPPFYDSLIAKLIVWGKDRRESIDRSKGALNEFIIEGINTTIPFYKKVLLNNNFLSGKIHTHFLDEEIL